MKKNYLVWFAFLVFLIIGCRNDNFNSNETNSNQHALKFRVVPRSEIPQIITALQAKTNLLYPSGASLQESEKQKPFSGRSIPITLLKPQTELMRSTTLSQ